MCKQNFQVRKKTSSEIRIFLHCVCVCVCARAHVRVFPHFSGILPLPSRTSCVFSLIVMSGSLRERMERKTAGEERIGSSGNDWEGRQLGNCFLWVAYGGELCSRRGVTSSGRFRGINGQEWLTSGSHWNWKKHSHEGILLDTPQRRPVREGSELLWENSRIEAGSGEEWNLSTTFVVGST